MDELNLFLDEKAAPLKPLTRQKNNPLTLLLIKVANEMPPNSERLLNPKIIKPSSAATKVSVLRKKGLIPKEVTTSQSGKELKLIRR